MYLLKLAIQKLVARPGSTAFSVLLFAIGCSIISLIILAEKNLSRNIERNFSGIDLVVGAKGSPTQLILSSVLHADYPTGNIKLADAENLARNPLVKKAIPLALGDSYRGFRIVGAPVDYPELYNAQLQSGNWYSQTLEAVLGSNVARSTGLKLGDQFYGVHGFQDAGHAHAEHVYTITGIIEPGAGVIDNLILTPVTSVWKVHEGHNDHEHVDDHDQCDHPDHDHSTHLHHDHDSDDDHAGNDFQEGQIPDPAIAAIQARIDRDEDISREEMELYQAFMQQRRLPTPDQNREITAMLLQFRSPAGLIQLTRLVNESTQMQAASPALEINRLLSLLSVGFDVFIVLAWIIIVISGINIFIHLWNTLRYELKDIALMRVLGAGRAKVFVMMIYQGAVIAFAGWLLGVVISRLVWVLLPSFHFITESPFELLLLQELWLLYYAVLTGIIASLIPAWTAYKTDVHFTLTRK
jgi:putative ABC transport system permease protein